MTKRNLTIKSGKIRITVITYIYLVTYAEQQFPNPYGPSVKFTRLTYTVHTVQFGGRVCAHEHPSRDSAVLRRLGAALLAITRREQPEPNLLTSRDTAPRGEGREDAPQNSNRLK